MDQECTWTMDSRTIFALIATISDATTRFTKGAVSEVFKRFASAEINSLAFELSAPQGRS